MADFKDNPHTVFENLTASDIKNGGKKISFTAGFMINALRFCARNQISFHNSPQDGAEVMRFFAAVGWKTRDPEVVDVLAVKLLTWVDRHIRPNQLAPGLREEKVDRRSKGKVWRGIWKQFTVAWTLESFNTKMKDIQMPGNADLLPDRAEEVIRKRTPPDRLARMTRQYVEDCNAKKVARDARILARAVLAAAAEVGEAPQEETEESQEELDADEDHTTASEHDHPVQQVRHSSGTANIRNARARLPGDRDLYVRRIPTVGLTREYAQHDRDNRVDRPEIVLSGVVEDEQNIDEDDDQILRRERFGNFIQSSLRQDPSDAADRRHIHHTPREAAGNMDQQVAYQDVDDDVEDRRDLSERFEPEWRRLQDADEIYRLVCAHADVDEAEEQNVLRLRQKDLQKRADAKLQSLRDARILEGYGRVSPPSPPPPGVREQSTVGMHPPTGSQRHRPRPHAARRLSDVGDHEHLPRRPSHGQDLLRPEERASMEREAQEDFGPAPRGRFREV